MAKVAFVEAAPEKGPSREHLQARRKPLSVIGIVVTIVLLFLHYFVTQFDKFVLSYFQVEVVESLSLTSTQYGI
jgi:hypothetical protein